MLFARFPLILIVLLTAPVTFESSAVAQNANATSPALRNQYCTQHNQPAGNVQIACLQPIGGASLQKQKDDAMNLFQTMQFGAAREAYNKLCGQEPNSAYDHYWLAESLYELNDFNAAANEFSRAANLEPQNEKTQLRLVEATLATRNFSLAREVALRAVPNVRDERLKIRLANVLRVATMGPPKAPTCGHAQNHLESARKK